MWCFSSQSCIGKSEQKEHQRDIDTMNNLVIFVLFFSLSAETPIEVTFSGSEYITYDLQQKGFEPILSTNDEISLYFKTS